MQNYRALLGILFLGLASLVAPAALGDSLTINNGGTSTVFTISGTFGSTVPTSAFSAPGESYSISFTLLTNASANSGFSFNTPGGFFDVNATLNFMLNGAANGTFNTQIEFDNLANGGGMGFFADAAGDSLDLLGPQLFHGSLSSPTFFSANPVFDSTGAMQSGYDINGQFVPFSTATPTPEPASLLLLGTGLLGLAAFVRRKFKSV